MMMKGNIMLRPCMRSSTTFQLSHKLTHCSYKRWDNKPKYPNHFFSFFFRIISYHTRKQTQPLLKSQLFHYVGITMNCPTQYNIPIVIGTLALNFTLSLLYTRQDQNSSLLTFDCLDVRSCFRSNSGFIFFIKLIALFFFFQLNNLNVTISLI